jgi:uncharacterized FlaG/YvyC family protein
VFVKVYYPVSPAKSPFQIVAHTEQQRELLEEENEVESAKYEQRIAELEEGLQIANDELARLTARMREMIDASEDNRSSFSYDSRVSEQVCSATVREGENIINIIGII